MHRLEACATKECPPTSLTPIIPNSTIARMWLARIHGYLCIPAALFVHRLTAGRSWEPTLTFVLAGLGIIPLASLMGEATEQLSERTGPTWGGLLNASFGNAAELIIGIVAISKGFNDVAKASLAGSILGNLLLVGGGAMLVGGWGRERQTFSRASAEANAGLLIVAVAGMLFPSIFDLSFHHRDKLLAAHVNGLSFGTSIILLLVYGVGLLFSLRTHTHVFSSRPSETPEDPIGMAGISGMWSVKRSVLALLIASTVVAVLSELLVGAVDQTAQLLGWNKIFVGVIVLAIIGNAAEHSTALMLARRNDMDTAMSIVFQSSLQIALFVTPVLVLLGRGFVHFTLGGARNAGPMNLVFTPLEVMAVFLTVIVIVILSRNGETNWFEGTLLLAVYAILAITFFYIRAEHLDGYDEIAPVSALVAAGSALSLRFFFPWHGFVTRAGDAEHPESLISAQLLASTPLARVENPCHGKSSQVQCGPLRGGKWENGPRCGPYTCPWPKTILPIVWGIR